MADLNSLPPDLLHSLPKLADIAGEFWQQTIAHTPALTDHAASAIKDTIDSLLTPDQTAAPDAALYHTFSHIKWRR